MMVSFLLTSVRRQRMPHQIFSATTEAGCWHSNAKEQSRKISSRTHAITFWERNESDRFVFHRECIRLRLMFCSYFSHYMFPTRSCLTAVADKSKRSCICYRPLKAKISTMSTRETLPPWRIAAQTHRKGKMR